MKTVLVVDDEAALAWGIGTVLQDEGYAVVTASNGVEALERLDAARADLIITDLMMPTMSGVDLLRRLGESPTLGAIPVIVMSAMARASAEALVGDSRVFLAKPVTVARLLAAVREVIGPP
ncbi:MAG: response regulator [Planctomycetes bacterium]|nr:response regulator [Planctomycetota bacterium]